VKHKYELMGQYVEVRAYLKPVRNFSARSHEPVILNKPRIGMVVGYRMVYDGITHPGRQDVFDNEDYELPWFEVIGKIRVLLVCFWPRYKPVLVKPEDANPNIHTSREVIRVLHPTVCPWDDRVREDYRQYAKEMRRDEKGRWIK